MSRIPESRLVLPTGFLGLDRRLGGGLPGGSVTEVSGGPGVGKSLFALSVIARAQADGLQAAFLDTDHALHLPWALEVVGISSALFFSQPTRTSQVLGITTELACSGAIDLVVIDSCSVLGRKEGARLFRELGILCEGTGITVLATSHVTMRGRGPWRRPESEGSWAAGLNCALRLQLQKATLARSGASKWQLRGVWRNRGDSGFDLLLDRPPGARP